METFTFHTHLYGWQISQLSFILFIFMSVVLFYPLGGRLMLMLLQKNIYLFCFFIVAVMFNKHLCEYSWADCKYDERK